MAENRLLMSRDAMMYMGGRMWEPPVDHREKVIQQPGTKVEKIRYIHHSAAHNLMPDPIDLQPCAPTGCPTKKRCKTFGLDWAWCEYHVMVSFTMLHHPLTHEDGHHGVTMPYGWSARRD